MRQRHVNDGGKSIGNGSLSRVAGDTDGGAFHRPSIKSLRCLSHVIGVVVKSPESGDEVLEVGASPLEHAQQVDGRVSVVVPDVLR